jgi:hypothetical protein
MDSNLEKDCSAIGGLFQQIITELKVSNLIHIYQTNKPFQTHSCLVFITLGIQRVKSTPHFCYFNLNVLIYLFPSDL